MRLSAKDLKVLSALELQADLSLSELRAAVGLQDHTIRYVLHKLHAGGIISQKRPIISNEALGYYFSTLFFSLSSRNQRRKDDLVNFLLSNPLVSWMFELGGDFQYGVSFKAHHVSQVRGFLDVLAKKFGNIFFEKALSTQLSFCYYGRRYLASNKQRLKPIYFSVDEQRQEIDELDQQIIDGLTEESYKSRNELAIKLKIPIATFERRRLSLQERGIIKGYFYWIDPAKLEVDSYIIMIFAHGINIDLRVGLRQFSEKEACVVYLTEAMGHWDFELGIEVANAQELTRITERIYDLFPDQIKTLKVVPILKYSKIKNYRVKI